MKNLSNAALDVLSSSVEITGPHVRIVRPLDRKLYVEVNAALEALGGAWNRKAKVHVFANDPADALDQVLVDGGFHDAKRDFQQFFTPLPLAAAVVARLGSLAGRTVLEPSAGAGAIVWALIERKAIVTAVEMDAQLAAKLPLDRRICADFLTLSPDNVPFAPFDAVAMNPPFTKGQDVAHVMHAFSFLKPGGKLVAIMSAGAEFRSDRKTSGFRELVAAMDGTIERLPDDSFKESGTSVRTVVVEMVKP